jgi:hypothetical protein
MTWLAVLVVILIIIATHRLTFSDITVSGMRRAWRRWRHARFAHRVWYVVREANDLAMMISLAVVLAHGRPLWAIFIIVSWLVFYALLLSSTHPYIHRAHALRRAWNRAATPHAPIGEPT